MRWQPGEEQDLPFEVLEEEDYMVEGQKEADNPGDPIFY